jgi:hypothetical protein
MWGAERWGSPHRPDVLWVGSSGLGGRDEWRRKEVSGCVWCRGSGLQQLDRQVDEEGDWEEQREEGEAEEGDDGVVPEGDGEVKRDWNWAAEGASKHGRSTLGCGCAREPR